MLCVCVVTAHNYSSQFTCFFPLSLLQRKLTTLSDDENGQSELLIGYNCEYSLSSLRCLLTRTQKQLKKQQCHANSKMKVIVIF